MFESHATYRAILPVAQSAMITDLNHDGIEDLAIVGGPGVSVLHGSGSGNFASADEYIMHLGAQSIAVADVNRDTWPDLVIAYQNAPLITVLFGSSNGTFFKQPDLPIPAGSKHIALGDLNGDSVPDLVLAVAESSAVWVLPGKGDGTFGTGARLGVGSKPTEVSLSDLNDDGVSDLIVVNSDSSSVSTFLGTADGRFDDRHDWAVGPGPTSVAVGDLNGDGRADMAVLNAAESGAGSISILFGTGAGDFSRRTDQPFVRGLKVIAADLNGDGKIDLATGSNGAAAVFLGNGDGTFGEIHDYDTGRDPQTVVSADFDGDNIADVAITNRLSSTVQIFLGSDEGILRKAADLNAGLHPYRAVTGDWNGDGRSDLAVTLDGGVAVLLANGDGTFRPRVEYPVGSGPAGITTADVNHDGVLDLLVANPSIDALTVLLGRGDGSFGAPVNTRVGHTQQGVLATADFNRDGNIDVAIARYAYPGFISILLGNGDGTFGHQRDIPTTPGDDPGSIAVGDLNSDGKPDLVVCNYQGSTIMTLLGLGDGTFSKTPTISYVIGPVALADLDGDGRTDLIDTAGAVVEVRQGKGDGTFQPAIGYGVFRGVVSMAVTDLDGDCQPDIAALGWGDVGSSKLWVLPKRAHPSDVRPAKAIVRAANRPISVGSGAPFFCVYVEPQGGVFETADINAGSVSMKSPRTGSVGAIKPAVQKETRAADLDRDGVQEVPVCFAREDLARLFSRIRGRKEVEVTIEGCLASGGTFRAPLSLTVLGTGKPESAVASLAPNPLNPQGTLTFSLVAPGSVTVRLYDLGGRFVRTVIDAERLPAGVHQIVIDGRDERGADLASGVYFYRVETPDGASTGRFVVLK